MKKYLVITMILMCALSCKSGMGYTEEGFNDNPVIAHRGAWKNSGHPQNSLASLRAATEMGCHGSEFDVHLTLDDSLVVNHDQDHHGMIIDSTLYADLIAVPLANGEKLSTAREYLAEGMKQSGTKLIIDVKTPKNKERAVDIAVATHKLVEQMGASRWVEYLAGELGAVDMLMSLSTLPVAYLGAYRSKTDDMTPKNVIERGVKYVDYRYIYYQGNPEWIKKFREAGTHLNAWVVDQPYDMDWFLAVGFDYITTDEPELLLKKNKKITDK